MTSYFLRVPSATLLATLVLVLTGVSINAQGRSVSIARRIDEFSKQNDKIAHDQMQGEAAGRKPTKDEARKLAKARLETKEDLESLQAAYNAIIGALSGGRNMPDADANEVSQKVHKHALRLRANAALPRSKEPAVFGEIIGRRKGLQELCLRIYALLTNPVIENPAVIEVDSARKASEALDAIILISGRLRHEIR